MDLKTSVSMNEEVEANTNEQSQMGTHAAEEHHQSEVFHNGFPLGDHGEDIVSPTGVMSPPELDVDFVLSNTSSNEGPAAVQNTNKPSAPHGTTYDEAVYAAAYQRQRWQQWQVWIQQYAAASAVAAARQGGTTADDSNNHQSSTAAAAAAAAAMWYNHPPSSYSNGGYVVADHHQQAASGTGTDAATEAAAQAVYQQQQQQHQQLLADPEYQKRLQAYWQHQQAQMIEAYQQQQTTNNANTMNPRGSSTDSPANMNTNTTKKGSSSSSIQQDLLAQQQYQQQMLGGYMVPTMDEAQSQEWARWMAHSSQQVAGGHDPYNSFASQMPAVAPIEQLPVATNGKEKKVSRKRPAAAAAPPALDEEQHSNTQQQQQQPLSRGVESMTQHMPDQQGSTSTGQGILMPSTAAEQHMLLSGEDEARVMDEMNNDDDDDEEDNHQPGKRGSGAPMKRARWGATHAIHEYFADGFPELQERFVRTRASAAQRRYEYNLGSCRFPDSAAAAKGLKRLKTLFRSLDAACEDVDQRLGNARREEFAKELRKWGWRRGARLQYRKKIGGKGVDPSPASLLPGQQQQITTNGGNNPTTSTTAQALASPSMHPATNNNHGTTSLQPHATTNATTKTATAARTSTTGGGNSISNKKKRPAPINHQPQQVQPQQPPSADWGDQYIRSWPGPPVPPAAMLAAAAASSHYPDDAEAVAVDAVSPEATSHAELWWQHDYTTMMSRMAQQERQHGGAGDEKTDEAALHAAQQQWTEAANAEAAQWGYPSAAAYQQAAAAAWYNYAAYQRQQQQHQQAAATWGEISPPSGAADHFSLGNYDHVVHQARGGVATDHDHHSLGPIDDDYDFEHFVDTSANQNHHHAGGKKKRKSSNSKSGTTTPPPAVIGLDDLAGLATSGGALPSNYTTSKKRLRSTSPSLELEKASLQPTASDEAMIVGKALESESSQTAADMVPTNTRTL